MVEEMTNELPDPNTGTREWTALAHVDSLVRDDRPLNWLTDTGDRPTDEYLSACGYVGLTVEPVPAYDASTHKAVPSATVLIATVAVQGWNIVPLSNDELRQSYSNELAVLDAFIPRGLEDQWAVTGFDTSLLPQVQRDRLSRKAELRTLIKGTDPNAGM